MKSTSKVLTGVTAVVLIFLVYLLAASRVSVRLVDVRSQPCAERPDAFENAVTAARLGDGNAIAFAADAPGTAGDYQFLTLTYEVTNFGLLPAEWISIAATPEQGDVLQVGGDWPDIQGLSRGHLAVAIVAPIDAPASGRAARLRYYVAGRPIFADATAE
ncbi:MAG: hypothetical protein GX558_03575 [Clostridiales bacterium]|nr:hypothetical protein [Clostridiales bacterium]